MHPLASSKSKFVFRMGQFSVKILKGEKLFHVRSVDCTGLHDGHAREFCSVPAMSFRFADSDILYFVGASAVWTLSKKPLFSDCDHITYMPKVTSAEFRWTQVALKCLNNMESLYPFHKLDLHTAPATRGIWTWVRFVNWPPLPWQCGNRAYWRRMETKRPPTSMEYLGQCDWNSHTLCKRGSL